MRETRPLSDRTAALAVSAGAALLGFAFVYPRQWTSGLWINDEMWYAELARNLYQGRGFVSRTLYPIFARQAESFPVPEMYKQIGYPLLVSIAWKMTGIAERPMLLVALAGLAGLGGASFLLGARLLGSRRLGLVVAGLTLGNPPLLAWWTAALPESVFAACFLALVLVLLEPTALGAAVAGILLVPLMLLKGYAFIYVPAVLAYLVLAAPAGASRARAAGGFLAAFVLALAVSHQMLPGASAQYAPSGGGQYQQLIPGPEDRSRDLDQVDPWRYIAAHPGEYVDKYVRNASRTKLVLEELGGPAAGPVLFPILLLALALAIRTATARVVAAARRPGSPVVPHLPPDVARQVLVLGLIVTNFAVFWGIDFGARFFGHLYPLMLVVVIAEARQLFGERAPVPRVDGRVLAAFATIYFIAYPAAAGLADAYRHPYAYLSQNLPVQALDYRKVTDTLARSVAPDGVVMSDMAHEISWLTGRNTVHFPGREDQLLYLADKFHVQALYEHPRFPRDWPGLARDFTLVDVRDGRLWVRRTATPAAHSAAPPTQGARHTEAELTGLAATGTH